MLPNRPANGTWSSRNTPSQPRATGRGFTSVSVTDPDRITPPSPLPSPHPHSKRPIRSLQSIFNRSAPKAPSLYSVASATDSVVSHPYAIMHIAPLPVVSNQDHVEEEEDCPVCLEPLSFSFRLPGEKPHIVPECGHALHEVREIFKVLLRRKQPFFNASEGFDLHTLSRHALQQSTAHPQVKQGRRFRGNRISEYAVSVDVL